MEADTVSTLLFGKDGILSADLCLHFSGLCCMAISNGAVPHKFIDLGGQLWR